MTGDFERSDFGLGPGMLIRVHLCYLMPHFGQRKMPVSVEFDLKNFVQTLHTSRRPLARSTSSAGIFSCFISSGPLHHRSEYRGSSLKSWITRPQGPHAYP